MHSVILKKIVIIMLAVIITGCSALPVDLSFLSTPTTGPTNTFEPTVTLIPSKEVSNTPDLFAVSTEMPTITPNPNVTLARPTRTPPPTITNRPTITLEPMNVDLFTPSAPIFGVPQKSTTQLVWGSTCDGARSIQFTVQVAHVKRMKYALLFYRLQDKYSSRNTGWGGGAIMKDNDKGTYFYTLELDQIDDYRNYEDAWLQYQFVASTIGLTHLGSSVVDRTSVSLTHCKALYP